MNTKTFLACLASIMSCSSLYASNLLDLGPMIRPVEYRDNGTILAIDMNDQVPFVWDEGKRTDMPGLVCSGSSLAIAARGDEPIERSVLATSGKYQVGWIADGNLEGVDGPTKRAAVWTKDRLRILPDMGFGGCARAVSERGWVVGYVQTKRTRGSAALWVKGELKLLPDDGIGYSEAFAVNSGGVIVGSAVIANQGCRAVVWDRDDMKILNKQCDLPEGWNLREATCINDKGDIAGMAEVNGLLHGFILR
ncbi:MAG: hypothetical protein ACYC1M_01345 [Armatimonadota bacterium]